MNDWKKYVIRVLSQDNGPCEIYHHGVKGQKWGVRHGPPYPIEDKVMRAGQKLEHVSYIRTGNLKPNTENLLKYIKNNNRSLYVYNPDNAWDKMVYRGPFAKYLRKYKSNGPLEIHSFVTKEDMKMPTKKQRINAFLKLLKKDDNKDQLLIRAEYIDELEGVKHMLEEQGIRSKGTSEDIWKVDFKNLKTEKDIKYAYEIFNHAMESAYRYKVTQAYVKYMCEKYDAMVDDNNQGIYNQARDPIVVFNVDKLAASPEAVKFLHDREIMERTETMRNVLRKYYDENVKL